MSSWDDLMTREVLPFSKVMDALGKDEQVSIPLLYRLSDLTPENLEEFCTFWSDLDVERRRVIARHLADISEENYQVDFSGVFAHCLSDPAVAVRLAALDGLWDTDRLALIAPIIALMESDPEEEVRALAAATLGHFVLMAEWQQIPSASSKPIVNALLAQLQDPSTPQVVRCAALESVSAATHPSISELIQDAYESGVLELQVSALFAMGRSADTRWLSIVVDELTSMSDQKRLEAAKAAGDLGRSDAIPNLAEMLYDEDLEIRLAAVIAMGQIGGDEAQRILQELAEDPSSYEMHDAIEDALEELSWLGGEIDLSLIDWENSQDNDITPEA